MGTATYDVAKRLNALIAQSMQKRHMIESTQEFIEIVKTEKQPKLLSSLDVNSLFTNVPKNDTLNIIIDAVHVQSPSPIYPRHLTAKTSSEVPY